jgi:hypothetical protein
MDTAIQYAENMNSFITALLQTPGFNNVEQVKGRRFDRVVVNGDVRFFVDKNTWEIFGAKSDFQYNPRRQYGKIDTTLQFDWMTLRPLAGTTIETVWLSREADIQKTYKPRGRPKKTPVIVPAPKSKKTK